MALDRLTIITSSGLSTVSDYVVDGIRAVGVVTASTVQVGAATTVHTTGLDLGSGNITSHNINSTGIITATGIDVKGVLSYEDVTNVDSVGVITARSGINVTGGLVGIGTIDQNAKLALNPFTTIPNINGTYSNGAYDLDPSYRHSTGGVSIANTENKTYPTDPNFNVNLGLNQNIEVGGTQTINPTTPGGYNFISGIRNFLRKEKGNTQDIERSYYYGINNRFIWNDDNTCKQYLGINDNFDYYGKDANGRIASTFIAKNVTLWPPDGGVQTIQHSVIADGSLTIGGSAGITTVSINRAVGVAPNLALRKGTAGTHDINITDYRVFGTSRYWGMQGSGGISTCNITNYYGLKLEEPQYGPEDIVVTNNFGVHSGWSDSKNYFAGSVGIATEIPRYPLEVNSGNLLVSGSAAANLILEDRSVGDSSRPFVLLASNDGNFTITNANRNASGTTTSSVERLRISSDGNVGIGTENPDTKLQVFNSPTTGQFKIGGGNGAGNHRVYINCSETNSYIDSYGNNAYGKLRINASPLLLNDAGGGSIGINGTTAPRAKFDFGSGTGNGTLNQTIANYQAVFESPQGTGNYSRNIGFAVGTNGISAAINAVDDGGNDATGLIFATGTAGSIVERLRIQSDGKILVYGSLGAGNLPLGGNAASAGLQVRGTNKYQGIAFGQGASNATIGIDNTKLVYTANANPANLGGGKQAAHEWWSGSSGGGGPTKLVEMTTDGVLYLGGYPTNHTNAAYAPFKLRSGSDAWAMSIGMRSSQNDYAYIGFTDMNGTEHIGDINMQRTGTGTGHMVFSTNNGSGGSEGRLRIADSGRLCYSPDTSFAQESTNVAMSIIASGGDVGGYPGINIRSTASGGNTNSQNGMSIVATDGHWSLYSNAGNVHGLGILAGNSASSSNAAFLARSDKKITMGPDTNSRAGSTNICGQAVHVAGGGLGVGSASNYSTRSGEGGRYVLGWYHANAYTGRSGNSYLHLSTSLWGGGSPAGNSEFIMGGFKIKSYRYSPSGVAEEIIMFHNWSGGVPGYSREHNGTWDPGNTVYVNSSGYITIRLNSQNYVGYIIDLIQYNWYPVRNITVTSSTFSNSSTI